MTKYSLLETYGRFGGTWRLNLDDGRKAKNVLELEMFSAHLYHLVSSYPHYPSLKMMLDLFHSGHMPINKKKQTPWPLVRERTIPTDRLPLVDEI
jgi:hypothetical protein